MVFVTGMLILLAVDSIDDGLHFLQVPFLHLLDGLVDGMVLLLDEGLKPHFLSVAGYH